MLGMSLILGPYWCKTATVNAARYRDVIKNLTPDDFYDNLFKTLFEGQL